VSIYKEYLRLTNFPMLLHILCHFPYKNHFLIFISNAVIKLRAFPSAIAWNETPPGFLSYFPALWMPNPFGRLAENSKICFSQRHLCGTQQVYCRLLSLGLSVMSFGSSRFLRPVFSFSPDTFSTFWPHCVDFCKEIVLVLVLSFRLLFEFLAWCWQVTQITWES